jgi:hypothetical protein
MTDTICAALKPASDMASAASARSYSTAAQARRLRNAQGTPQWSYRPCTFLRSKRARAHTNTHPMAHNARTLGASCNASRPPPPMTVPPPSVPALALEAAPLSVLAAPRRSAAAAAGLMPPLPSASISAAEAAGAMKRCTSRGVKPARSRAVLVACGVASGGVWPPNRTILLARPCVRLLRPHLHGPDVGAPAADQLHGGAVHARPGQRVAHGGRLHLAKRLQAHVAGHAGQGGREEEGHDGGRVEAGARKRLRTGTGGRAGRARQPSAHGLAERPRFPPTAAAGCAAPASGPRSHLGHLAEHRGLHVVRQAQPAAGQQGLEARGLKARLLRTRQHIQRSDGVGPPS